MLVVEMSGICKDYTLSDGSTTPILKSIDLTIESGEFAAIMGSSGAGKSTLMNILGTLDRPSRGLYYLDGEDTGRRLDHDIHEAVERNWNAVRTDSERSQRDLQGQRNAGIEAGR